MSPQDYCRNSVCTSMEMAVVGTAETVIKPESMDSVDKWPEMIRIEMVFLCQTE